MKKLKIVFIPLILLVAFALALVNAVTTKPVQASASTYSTTLNLQLNGTMLSWNDIPEATYYRVMLSWIGGMSGHGTIASQNPLDLNELAIQLSSSYDVGKNFADIGSVDIEAYGDNDFYLKESMNINFINLEDLITVELRVNQPHYQTKVKNGEVVLLIKKKLNSDELEQMLEEHPPLLKINHPFTSFTQDTDYELQIYGSIFSSTKNGTMTSADMDVKITGKGKYISSIYSTFRVECEVPMDVAMIVGITVGGAAALAVIVAIVLIARKKRQTNSKESSKSKVGLWLAFCPPIFGTMVWHMLRMLEKNNQSILDVERTPHQQELFEQSKVYENLEKSSPKTKKVLFIFLASIVGWILIPLFWFQWLFISSRGKSSIKKHGEHLYNTCIKCGFEKAEITNRKFLRTHYTNETVENSVDRVFKEPSLTPKILGSYAPPAEIIATERIKKWNKHINKFEWFDIYQLKYTHHEYEVARKCPQCQHEWKLVEDLPEPPNTQPQVNVQIENYHEVKKDLPFVYCSQCGGKNKGDSIYCYHCGKAMTKPE